ISANIRRRNLTAEQTRDLIAKLIKAAPAKSNRRIAKEAGASHPHVAKVRGDLEKSGDVETVTTSIDTKGRKQPAKRVKPVAEALNKAPRRTRVERELDAGAFECPIFEVFFGGARGGGKTDGMLGEWVRHADLYGEHAIGLMLRRTRTELIETI